MLKKLQQQGITILVSTPYMDEAALCDRIGLLQDGTLMRTGSPQDITQGFDRPLYAASGGEPYPLLQALRRQPGVERVFPFGTSLHITAKEQLDLRALGDDLVRQGFPAVDLRPIAPGVEDLFMHLMQ
ncbi:MAG: hypothetical protein M9900_09955 [Flavobacteriales bacterium]|nr:hypothetical protein [Flavobacteriales bacterium]